jgi:hypothetical protein
MVPRTDCNPRGRNAHHNEIRTGITDRRSTESTEQRRDGSVVMQQNRSIV